MVGLHPESGIHSSLARLPQPRRRLAKPRFGLIVNPKSTGNLGRVATGVSGIEALAPETHADLRSVLRDLARRETNHLLVRGGDGTIREVLSALPDAYGSAPLPAIALVKAGRTDLVAGEVGGCADDDEVERLIARARDGELVRVRRPVLRAERVIDEHGAMRTVRGLLLGAGVFTHATQVGQRLARDEGTSHSAMILRAVATVLRQVVIDGDPDGLLRGRPIGLVDASERVGGGVEATRFLVLISGLRERLFLGRSPFWGPAQDDELRHLTIAGPARNLARSFAALAIDRPHLAGEDWRSGASKALVLDTVDPFVIDGELFRPPPEGFVRVFADRPVTFVSP